MLLNMSGIYVVGDTNTDDTLSQANYMIYTAKDLDSLKEDIESGALQQYFEQLPGKIAEFGIKVLLAFIVLFLGLKLIKIFRKFVKRSLEKTNVEKGVIQFTDSLLKTLLTIILVIGIAVNLGVEATSIAALISSISIAIGLALQGSLSNFAGGLLLLALKPFKVGDYIKEDTHGNEGTVKEITMFYTKLLSYDNKTIVLPNGILANSSMVNYSDDGRRRIDLKFEVSYEADIKKVKELVMVLLDENKLILQNMQKIVFVSDLGTDGVKVGVRCFTKSSDYFPVYWQLLEDIKYTLDENNIGIPYPQLDVHLDK